MNPQNIEQVAEIIKKNLAPIAEKIGVGFEIFKVQAKVNAAQYLAVSVIISIIMIIGAIKIFKAKLLDDMHPDDKMAFQYVLGGLLLVVSTVIFICSLFNFVGTFINPNYYAIELLINLK